MRKLSLREVGLIVFLVLILFQITSPLKLDFATATEYGILYVDTTPVKGGVTVNTEYFGTAPQSRSLTAPQTYVVYFGDVSGYRTPPPQTVTLQPDQTTTVTGVYEKIHEEPTPTPPTPTPSPRRYCQVDVYTNKGGYGIGNPSGGTYLVGETITIFIELSCDSSRSVLTIYKPDGTSVPNERGPKEAGTYQISNSASFPGRRKVVIVAYWYLTFDSSNDHSTDELYLDVIEERYAVSVSVSPSGAGYVTGGGTYSYGDTCTLTTHAYEGYEFDYWAGDLSGSVDPMSFTVTKNMDIVAYFKEKPHATQYGTLYVDTIPVKGGVTVNTEYFGIAPRLIQGLAAPQTYMVYFGDVTGYKTPAPQSVTLQPDQTASVTGVYEMIETISTTSTTEGEKQTSGSTPTESETSHDLGKLAESRRVIYESLGNAWIQPVIISVFQPIIDGLYADIVKEAVLEFLPVAKAPPLRNPKEILDSIDTLHQSYELIADKPASEREFRHDLDNDYSKLLVDPLANKYGISIPNEFAIMREKCRKERNYRSPSSNPLEWWDYIDNFLSGGKRLNELISSEKADIPKLQRILEIMNFAKSQASTEYYKTLIDFTIDFMQAEINYLNSL